LKSGILKVFKANLIDKLKLVSMGRLCLEGARPSDQPQPVTGTQLASRTSVRKGILPAKVGKMRELTTLSANSKPGQ